MTRSPLTALTVGDDCAARVFVAIELSKKSWHLGILLPEGGRMRVDSVAACDGDGLVACLERYRVRAERATGVPVEVISCYEAGYDGFWLHRLLEANGIVNHVIDPASIEVNRHARRVKTDRVDLERLLRALTAYVRGERGMVSMVCVPSPEDEDARQLHRERHCLIGERVRHTNRIKSLCAVQGVYDYEPEQSKRFERLEMLRTYRGDPFPERLKARILRELRRLELVMEMIKELETECEALASEARGHPQADKIARLSQLGGIGPVSATVLAAEVFYRSFDNRRHVASYVGLTPSPFASGGLERDQGISKAGNRLVRTTMVQLSWLWLRYQPDSDLAKWFCNRVGKLKGRPRRIAIIALARKLLVALWRYVETGLVPTGATLKAGKSVKLAA